MAPRRDQSRGLKYRLQPLVGIFHKYLEKMQLHEKKECWIQKNDEPIVYLFGSGGRALASYQTFVKIVAFAGRHIIMTLFAFWKCVLKSVHSLFKGQLNSDWIYEVIVSPKIATKKYKRESIFLQKEHRLSCINLEVVNFQGRNP